MTTETSNTTTVWDRSKHALARAAYHAGVVGMLGAGIYTANHISERKNNLGTTEYGTFITPLDVCVQTSIPRGSGPRITEVYDLGAERDPQQYGSGYGYHHTNLHGDRVYTTVPVSIITDDGFGSNGIDVMPSQLDAGSRMRPHTSARFDTMTRDDYRLLLHKVGVIQEAGARSVDCASLYAAKER